MLMLVAQIGLSPAVSFTFGWCRKIQKTDNDNEKYKRETMFFFTVGYLRMVMMMVIIVQMMMTTAPKKIHGQSDCRA